MKTQMTWVEIICISNRKNISTQKLHPRVDDTGVNTVNLNRSPIMSQESVRLSGPQLIVLYQNFH